MLEIQGFTGYFRFIRTPRASNSHPMGEPKMFWKVLKIQSIQEDMDNRDPGRPWRVLLLNYAITATRTYNTDLMEKAFQFLVLNLSDDLKQFFTEGMSQMTALDYPKPVKKVMEKYYRQYAAQEIKSN